MRTISHRSIQTAHPAPAETAGQTLMNRRRALALMGGGAVASAGLLSLNRSVVQAQEGEGSPVPVVTPVFGPQADGSTMWRVQVGEMNMEEQYEFHAFFPGEITINEGEMTVIPRGVAHQNVGHGPNIEITIYSKKPLKRLCPTSAEEARRRMKIKDGKPVVPPVQLDGDKG